MSTLAATPSSTTNASDPVATPRPPRHVRICGALRGSETLSLQLHQQKTLGEFTVTVGNDSQCLVEGALAVASMWTGEAVTAIDTYRSDGPASLLPGSVLYDKSADLLVLAGPLYLVERDGGISFADSPEALFMTGLMPEAHDEAIIRFIRASATDEGDVTFFRHIRRIPSGYVALYRGRTVSVVPSVARVGTPSAEAVRFGQGLPGAVAVCRYENVPIYQPLFGAYQPEEDVYGTEVLGDIAPGRDVRHVDVSADSLMGDLGEFVATMGEPVADIAAYVQFAIARAVADDGLSSLVDPIESIVPVSPRRAIDPASILAAEVVVGQSASPVSVSDWSPVWSRVAQRLRHHFGVTVIMPFVEAEPHPVAIPPSRRRRVGGRRHIAPLHEWLLRRKNDLYEIFHSESFENRPWFDHSAVRLAFEGFTRGRNTDAGLIWRVLLVELWAREFLDDKRQLKLPSKAPLETNPGKEREIVVAGEEWVRIPVRTELFADGDPLDEKLATYVGDVLTHARQHSSAVTTQWYAVVSGKIVAVSQGRSFFIWDITPGWWARALSKHVVKPPSGGGLGNPWTMQLAIDEAGLPRVLIASAVSALGKIWGKRGWFYRVAGHNVSLISAPKAHAAYPGNVSAKLPPTNASATATQLRTSIVDGLRARGLTAEADAFAGCVILDANDTSCAVLGQDADRPRSTFEAVFADNPLGQGREQTPLAVVFPV